MSESVRKMYLKCQKYNKKFTKSSFLQPDQKAKFNLNYF